MISDGNAPVVHHGSFIQCICLGYIIYREIVSEESFLFAFDDQTAHKLVIGSVGVEQSAVSVGTQLRCKKLRQKRYRYVILYHEKELTVDKEQFINRIKLFIHTLFQFFVFFVKQVG